MPPEFECNPPRRKTPQTPEAASRLKPGSRKDNLGREPLKCGAKAGRLKPTGKGANRGRAPRNNFFACTIVQLRAMSAIEGEGCRASGAGCNGTPEVGRGRGGVNARKTPERRGETRPGRRGSGAAPVPWRMG